MGGGAFNWLKMPGIVRKSPNQAEIRLADLQKILSNRRKRDHPVGEAGPQPAVIVNFWEKCLMHFRSA
jgi:hypothetical protein